MSDCGGYVESSSLDGGTYRWGYFTVRIPRAKFQDFCDRAGALCQLNSKSVERQNVSEQYYDTESRLTTQRTKLERLQTLLSQATQMEDIITLESAIADTELTIERLTGTLRNYDSLVDYSTVDITLHEVSQLSGTVAAPIGFGETLAAAFRTGSRNFVYGVQDVLLSFARGWAGWLIFAAVVVGGKLMGVGGMLFFIPLCSVLYALFRDFVKGRLAEKKVPARKWRDPPSGKQR